MREPEAESAARLLERILAEDGYAQRFLADPAAACSAAGLASVAAELPHDRASAIRTLDVLEARAGLAGFFVAAAVEGMGLLDSFTGPDPVAPSVELRQVLAKVELPPPPPDAQDEAAEAVANAKVRRLRVEVDDEEPPPPRHRPVDPSELGREGSGGKPTPETRALLKNPRVHFDDVGQADLKAGRIDPRVVAVLTRLSRDHEITVTCMCSDHPRGPGSNHYYGRGVDIGTVDGEIVRDGSGATRKLAESLRSLPAGIRPSEVGTPFGDLVGGAYFNDAAHENHVHIGYDDEISRDWRPPGTVAAVAQERPRRPKIVIRDSREIEVEEQPAPDKEVAAVDGPRDYPGDDAPREQIAAWMAAAAQRRGLPPELPVMAALVESNLRNLPGGDADSVGYFQIRTSIHNNGAYAGYPDDPELQLKWFLDHAEAARDGRSNRNPTDFGEWVADTERPAERFRYRYQERLAEAQKLLSRRPGSGP